MSMYVYVYCYCVMIFFSFMLYPVWIELSSFVYTHTEFLCTRLVFFKYRLTGITCRPVAIPRELVLREIQSHPGFELWLPCPFPMLVTITQQSPPHTHTHIYMHVYIYICMCIYIYIYIYMMCVCVCWDLSRKYPVF